MTKRFILSALALGSVVLIVAQTAPPQSDPRTVSLSNVKQLSTGMLIYITDFDDVFPYPQTEKGWQMPIYPYLKNKNLYRTLNPAKPEFFRFNMALGGVSATAIGSPTTMPMFYDPTAWPDGKYLHSRTDTSSKFVEASTWKAIKKDLTAKLKRSAKPLPKNWGDTFKL